MADAGGRVLVVEDDDSVALVLADLLEDEGFEVKRAANGRAGLDLLKAFRPQLVLLDLMMPVLDGWGFRAQQRELTPDLAQIPVLVLSGARDAGTFAADLGAAGVVAKPFEVDALADTVRRLLSA
ncbi:MAG TPA: response regulator [Chloroflexota bacterium]|jgi:two-component system, chemotaxis family, chemotaxis protein CheY|nr:response regulator [Chloroflexota bacterium]